MVALTMDRTMTYRQDADGETDDFTRYEPVVLRNRITVILQEVDDPEIRDEAVRMLYALTEIAEANQPDDGR